jgi:hypothetical protein
MGIFLITFADGSTASMKAPFSYLAETRSAYLGDVISVDRKVA